VGRLQHVNCRNTSWETPGVSVSQPRRSGHPMVKSVMRNAVRRDLITPVREAPWEGLPFNVFRSRPHCERARMRHSMP
jgi:hypothetical protein